MNISSLDVILPTALMDLGVIQILGTKEAQCGRLALPITTVLRVNAAIEQAAILQCDLAGIGQTGGREFADADGALPRGCCSEA